MRDALHTSRTSSDAYPVGASRNDVALELTDLKDLIFRSYTTVDALLARLRESQALLRQRGLKPLRDTTAKLHEITTTTENATICILDGLDRSLELVSQLDSGASPKQVGTDLREELFGMMAHLQFQDVTAQQLQHTTHLLRDMEHHLLELARSLDEQNFKAPLLEEEDPRPLQVSTFDPCATADDAQERQAVVDALLALHIDE